MKRFTYFCGVLTRWAVKVYRDTAKAFWTTIWYRYNVRVHYDHDGGWSVLPNCAARITVRKGSYLIRGYKRRTLVPCDKVLSVNTEARPEPLTKDDFRPIRGRSKA